MSNRSIRFARLKELGLDNYPIESYATHKGGKDVEIRRMPLRDMSKYPAEMLVNIRRRKFNFLGETSR